MNAEHYRDALSRLGLSQTRAAKLMGVNERTSRRWALGEIPVPRLVALLLYLLRRFRVKVDDLPEDL
jgi:transcriptional regulator with XRE-family HTH domain